MPPIEVLQVIPELDPGGAEMVLLRLCQGLPRDRFHVSVAAIDGRGPLAEAVRAAGCTVHDLGGRSRLAPRAVAKLRQLVREVKPKIVHSHLFRAHLATAWAARGSKTTPITIATEHQADPRDVALRILRLATRKFTRITAVSEAVHSHLVHHGFAAAHLSTVANGVAVETIEKAKPLQRRSLGLAKPKDIQLAIFVGRITHQKGLDVLLRAMKLLEEDRPDLHLLVVGATPASEGLDPLKSIAALTRKLKLASHVHFLGWRDDVPALLKTVDLAVMPSRWEGLSLVLLEAMAAGLPVVATQVEGHGETVKNGANGLLVPPENPEALAAAMGRILSDAVLAKRLGAAAHETVQRDYTAEAMVKRYAALYEDLLAAGH